MSVRAMACALLLLLASPFARAEQNLEPNCYSTSAQSANCSDMGHAVAGLVTRFAPLLEAVTPTGKAQGFTKLCWVYPTATLNRDFTASGLGTVSAKQIIARICSDSTAGQWGQDSSRYYPVSKACDTRVQNDDWAAPEGDPTGDICSDGCAYEQVLDTQASGGSFYAPSGGTCTVNDQPVNDVDGDGVPDLEDAFPNDPTEATDTDGDGIGDNADFSPDDETDGKDTPGEEDGDDEGDNEASGGGTCEAPPTCSGDGIQCAQLFQQWKIVCKGAKVTGSPEHCEASYTCTGDSAQCAQIALLRKQACTEQGAGGVLGDSNGNGQPDWTEANEPARDDPGADDDVNDLGIGLNPNELLDTENIFGMGSCQDFSITVMGTVVSTADLDGLWCSRIAPIMRAVILLMGAFFAIRLLMGGT